MAVEQGSSSSWRWRLESGQYMGEISALSLLSFPHRLSALPYLLAGSGSQLLVYDLEVGKMINSFYVFQGIRVHGISASSSSSSSSSDLHSHHIAVFGERRVKLFSLDLLAQNNQPHIGVGLGLDLTLLRSLPQFPSWVLDVCFLKGHESSNSSCLAVGCSDNSVLLWDISNSSVILQVHYPERSLLYSMRLWGDSLEALRIASGTINNEIIVWKVDRQDDPISGSLQQHYQKYKAIHKCKLVGHEGSIFRLTWSSDGSKLVSVSDDRSARVWTVCDEIEDCNKSSESVGLVLFGHSARVWDCCIFDSLIVTAGEDCTCRVWGLDGKQLQMIKEHLGRGIWRCLYDPKFSILITAGFDSSIKVHQLDTTLYGSLEGNFEAKEIERTNTYAIHIPSSSDHIGLTDSKSEYVRCLRFTNEDALYVATNHGYLYHAKLSDNGDIYWTEIVRVGEKVPIVCMDLLSKPSKPCTGDEDWIAVGDGKGNMTIARVSDVCSPKVDITFTWSAGQERQLLGTHWCKPLGYNYVFTADPRGTLKLWRLCDPSQSFSYNSAGSCNVTCIAEFTACFGIRIMCLDASIEDEVLVCGDKRGNLVLFPLLKSMLVGTSAAAMKISALTYFKGAHGISSVTTVAVARLNSNQIEIQSTGGDGCICSLEYDKDRQNLEFIGMKQVKELSLIQSVCTDNYSVNESSIAHFAAGFASVDFMIWNLKTETKVLQIPCGGWRRPHSYYIGDLPEIRNCFAYVKDEVIHIHRLWEPDGFRKIYPQNLHMQFHGREMHSLCFITEELHSGASGKHNIFSGTSLIATGCEDGTVRMTRYAPGVENWSESKLLGEHVGGSAVRSICYVSKIHVISSDVSNSTDGRNEENASGENKQNPFILISVGAKRVLTSWLLRNRKPYKMEDTPAGEQHNATGNGNSSEMTSSMSFQWLSTDVPPKYSSSDKYTRNTGKMIELAENTSSMKADEDAEDGKMELKSCTRDKCEDDWRYLAVTAFLVKCAGSRLTVCFVVVACSDATLTLRALVLPHRLWFDVALLVPLSSPVLALQHVIIPTCLSSKEKIKDRSVYIVISGATDGSIAFWDLTESVEAFMRRVSVLHVEKFIDCQKRPRTGRGSQGGRWWRSLGSSMSKNRESGPAAKHNLLNCIEHGISSMESNSDSSMTTSQSIYIASDKSEFNTDDSSSEICKICPLHVLENSHQSGVNCLHVSDVNGCQSSESDFIYSVLSGGDDQALHCLRFDLELLLAGQEAETITPEIKNSITELGNAKNFVQSCQNKKKNYRIRFLSRHKVLSAHTSAVKGIWTDGSWVFSTGLDQRIRCWRLEEQGKITEYAYVIISVPEPEALDARVCSRGYYQIAVAGRGMQMAEFSAFCNMDP